MNDWGKSVIGLKYVRDGIKRRTGNVSVTFLIFIHTRPDKLTAAVMISWTALFLYTFFFTFVNLMVLN